MAPFALASSILSNTDDPSSQGRCKGSNTAKEIGSWIHDNKNLVIGIACGVGGLLLLSILSCIVRCCRRPRKARRTQPVPPPAMMQQGWTGGPGGAWMSSPHGQGRGRGGVGGGYGGTWGDYPPPPPPPHGWTQPSVRYA